MHHVNQPMSPSYQNNTNRNQFSSASGVPGMAPGTMGRVVRGAPVVLRMSPQGVPTYYYYAPQLQQQQQPLTSSPNDTRSSGTQTPPTMSPIPSGPNSPNQNHVNRQLHVSPSNPFHFQQQQHIHYGAASIPDQTSPPLLHQSYNTLAPPAFVQQSHCFFSPPASPSPPRTPPPSNQVVQPQKLVQSPYPPSPLANQRQVTVPQQQPHRYNARAQIASGTSAVAIDNKIEQAMDLVKSHLMFAVREEVEVLKEKIAELMERINQLEVENSILKAHASTETLAQLGGGGAGVGGQPVVTPGASMQMQAQGQQQAS